MLGEPNAKVRRGDDHTNVLDAHLRGQEEHTLDRGIPDRDAADRQRPPVDHDVAAERHAAIGLCSRTIGLVGICHLERKVVPGVRVQ